MHHLGENSNRYCDFAGVGRAERARPGRSNMRRQNSRRDSKHPSRYHVAAPGDGRAPVLPTKLNYAFISKMKAKRLPSPPKNTGVRDLVTGKRASLRPLGQDEIKSGFLGWHEKGFLPHRDEPGLVQFVSFRLADAFPAELRSEWEGLLEIEDDRVRRIKLENYLDLGRGSCHLRHPDIAKVVEDSLLFRHEIEYDLRAWAIMPNHVHLLFLVKDVPMSQLVDAWKGFTAKAINRRLGRRGHFWQEDYWDTYMRDGSHEVITRRYIENNPVKARLVASPKEWGWSSARYRDAYERLCVTIK